jgi:transposase
VGTPKSLLKDFEQRLLDKGWETVEPGVDVKLCSAPDGGQETFVLCRSAGRMEKERAIRQRQRQRLQTALDNLKMQIYAPKRALRSQSQAERRVGRLFQKYSRAARFFQVEIQTAKDPAHKSKKRLTMTIAQHQENHEWAELSDGCYLLRTNLTQQDAPTLWKTYIGLTQIEDSFRINKHDMGLRPIYHHKQDRTQAHILVCFLALVMWRTLQQWMNGCGLGTAPRKLLEQMAEVRSLDIVLPTATATEIRLRTVSRPDTHLAILLQKLGLPLPNKPKSI